MTKAAYQYELLQKIDGDDVVTEVNRLVETIGVDLILIGIGNAYATALVRLLRPLAPVEWNSFCEHAERYSWKISLVQGGMQSRSGVTAAGFCTEPERNGVGITEGIDEMHAAKPLSPKGRGLAHAFDVQEYNQYGDAVANGFVNTEQEEEDQDLSTSGSNTPTASAPVNRSYQWHYKKFGLR